jgi:hypothetical protein
LLNGKKSPKNVFLIVLVVCCPQTARPCCWLRTARIPARDHLRFSLQVTGIELLVNDHCTPCSRGGLKQEREKDLVLNLTALGFVPSRVSRSLIPVALSLLRRWSRAGMRASAASSTDVLSADSVLGEKKKRFLVTFCRLAKSYPLVPSGSS